MPDGAVSGLRSRGWLTATPAEVIEQIKALEAEGASRIMLQHQPDGLLARRWSRSLGRSYRRFRELRGASGDDEDRKGLGQQDLFDKRSDASQDVAAIYVRNAQHERPVLIQRYELLEDGAAVLLPDERLDLVLSTSEPHLESQS